MNNTLRGKFSKITNLFDCIDDFVVLRRSIVETQERIENLKINQKISKYFFTCERL